jgi:hypothetical protein
LGIDQAGSPNTNANQLVSINPGSGYSLFSYMGDVVQDIFRRGVGFVRHFEVTLESSEQISHPNSNVSHPNVYPDRGTGRGNQTQRYAGSAHTSAPVGLWFVFDNHSMLDKPGYQICNCGSGQTGQMSQLNPRNGSLTEHGSQYGLQIVCFDAADVATSESGLGIVLHKSLSADTATRPNYFVKSQN